MIAKTGYVVELYNNKKIISAYCFDVVKGSTLKCFSEEGKELKIQQDKILSSVPSANTDMTDKDSLKKYLKSVSADRDLIAESISINDLWELCLEDKESYSLNELAEIWFGSKFSDNELYALQRLLLEGTIYFKRKNELFIVNSKDEVNKIIVQREAENKKKIRTNQFIEMMKKICSGNMNEIPKEYKDFSDELVDVALYKKDSKYFNNVVSLCKEAGFSVEELFNFLVKASVFDIDENLMLRKFKIPIEFSNKIEEEVQNIINSADNISTDGYEDFTFLNVITIDDEKTTDIDDGISIEEDDDKIRIGVHITDASSFIPVDSTLDEEALARSTSIYLPDLKINMLPPIISENCGSLCENKNRKALSFFFEIERILDTFEIKKFYIKKTIIKSHIRLTYDMVDEILESDHNLSLMYKIALYFLNKRKSEGAIILFRKNVNITVKDKIPYLSYFDADRPSSVIVSEFMLLANCYSGKFCHDNNIPTIYRNQPAPTPEEIATFDLTSEEGKFRVRKFLKKVVLASESSGHFSIGCKYYIQVTSPLRRYVDLVIHRQLKSFLDFGFPYYSRERIEYIISMANNSLIDSIQLEKDRNRYWLLKYIEMHRNEPQKVIVLRTSPDKVYVRHCDTFLEVDIPTHNPSYYCEGQIAEASVVKVSAREDTLKLTFNVMSVS